MSVNKRTIAIGTAVTAAILILVLAPWLVCLEFEEPKQAGELEKLFADISVKNAQFTASGVDRIYLMIHKRDYGITSMDSFHIALVWFDDLGEEVVHFFNKSL